MQPILVALEKKHLLPKDTDPDLVQEMKSSIQSKLEEHLPVRRESCCSLVQCLTLIIKSFKFLSSTRISSVYETLITAAAQLQAAEEDIPESPPPPKRHKRNHRVFWIIVTLTAAMALPFS